GWERAGDRFTFRVQLPPNVTASVRIPSDDAAKVRDTDGNPPLSAGGFPGARDAQEAIFHVGSGTHEFTGPAMTGSGHHRQRRARRTGYGRSAPAPGPRRVLTRCTS